MWYAAIQLPVPIPQAVNPQPAPPERAPAGPDQVILSRKQGITLYGSGPVNQILEWLAVAVGWRVEKTVSLPTMPMVAVWADKQPLSSIVRQINAQMQGIATVILSPATKTIVLGAPHAMNAYPITSPDQPPAIVGQVQQPDLQGFQKSLSVEPVLAQIGKEKPAPAREEDSPRWGPSCRPSCPKDGRCIPSPASCWVYRFSTGATKSLGPTCCARSSTRMACMALSGGVPRT